MQGNPSRPHTRYLDFVQPGISRQEKENPELRCTRLSRAKTYRTTLIPKEKWALTGNR